MVITVSGVQNSIFAISKIWRIGHDPQASYCLGDVVIESEIGLDGDTQAQESVFNVTIYFELGFYQEVLPLAAPHQVWD